MRKTGTEVDGNVYQVPRGKTYSEGYDNIEWDREDAGRHSEEHEVKT
ncbi:MAG: hypothetical protein ACW99G_16465 [Candidatus Thorarchaeota archaeon]